VPPIITNPSVKQVSPDAPGKFTTITKHAEQTQLAAQEYNDKQKKAHEE
jgi:hypothetical protein